MADEDDNDSNRDNSGSSGDSDDEDENGIEADDDDDKNRIRTRSRERRVENELREEREAFIAKQEGREKKRREDLKRRVDSWKQATEDKVDSASQAKV